MTAKEKNKKELKLVLLKGKFIDKGILKHPTMLVSKYTPKKLSKLESIKWNKQASDVWNCRSTKYDPFLSIFEKIYKNI